MKRATFTSTYGPVSGPVKASKAETFFISIIFPEQHCGEGFLVTGFYLWITRPISCCCIPVISSPPHWCMEAECVCQYYMLMACHYDDIHIFLFCVCCVTVMVSMEELPPWTYGCTAHIMYKERLPLSLLVGDVIKGDLWVKPYYTPDMLHYSFIACCGLNISGRMLMVLLNSLGGKWKFCNGWQVDKTVLSRH